jgi:murein DD-endopeptidase MepM/ murein hydrolase activator NlpD
MAKHQDSDPVPKRALRLTRQTRALSRRFTTTAQALQAVTSYLQTDEFRWRALVTTGRYTSHSMVILVGVVAVLLAGFRVTSWIGQPKTTAAETSQATVAKKTANTLDANRGGDSTTDLSVRNLAGASSQTFSTADSSVQPTGNAPGNLPGNAPLPIPQNQPSISFGPRPKQDNGVLTRQIVLDTVKPVETRQVIETYTVRAGDTIEAIAARFGLLPTTLIWSNQDVEDAPDKLQVGQVLNVLPVNGIYYTVEDGDSAAGIAEKFKAKVDDIFTSPLNGLQPNANLIAGTKIVIPGGVKPFKARVVETASTKSGNAGTYAYTAPAPAYSGATGNFLWPAAASYVSQGFWWGHRALDIAASVGVPIYASDSGCVSYAGWSNVGYGYMVLINHGNGFQTLYAHMSQYYVDAGQCVNRGAVIGAMGSTGNSTGPHLHFEIRVNGAPDNPYYYLQ